MDRDEFMEIVYETFADEPDNVLANGIIEAADAYVEHEKAQLSQEDATFDLIDRQQAIDGKIIIQRTNGVEIYSDEAVPVGYLKRLPSAQPDYTEMKQEFLRMAGYIGVLLECSDEQMETLLGFISRLSEFMPWTQED